MRRLGAGVLTVLAVGNAVACGGSGPKRDPAAESRVVAETNALCRRASTLPPISRRSEQLTRALQHRFYVLGTELGNTAAYLPAGRNLNEAHADRRALFAEGSERQRAGLARGSDFNVRFNRLQLRIYRDELALGLKCALVPEARHLAAVLGAS